MKKNSPFSQILNLFLLSLILWLVRYEFFPIFIKLVTNQYFAAESVLQIFIIY